MEVSCYDRREWFDVRRQVVLEEMGHGSTKRER